MAKTPFAPNWGKGLQHLPDLHFTVENVRISVDTVVINYRNERH